MWQTKWQVTQGQRGYWSSGHQSRPCSDFSLLRSQPWVSAVVPKDVEGLEAGMKSIMAPWGKHVPGAAPLMQRGRGICPQHPITPTPSFLGPYFTIMTPTYCLQKWSCQLLPAGGFRSPDSLARRQPPGSSVLTHQNNRAFLSNSAWNAASHLRRMLNPKAWCVTIEATRGEAWRQHLGTGHPPLSTRGGPAELSAVPLGDRHSVTKLPPASRKCSHPQGTEMDQSSEKPRQRWSQSSWGEVVGSPSPALQGGARPLLPAQVRELSDLSELA